MGALIPVNHIGLFKGYREARLISGLQQMLYGTQLMTVGRIETKEGLAAFIVLIVKNRSHGRHLRLVALRLVVESLLRSALTDTDLRRVHACCPSRLCDGSGNLVLINSHFRLSLSGLSSSPSAVAGNLVCVPSLLGRVTTLGRPLIAPC